MRRALRRILWIVPTLFAISLVTFFWLSSAGWQVHRETQSDSEHPLFGVHARPRFFNPKPQSVRERAQVAMAHVAADDAWAAPARAELTRLGGAALPYVLPRLDSLPPAGRARVALALEGLGRRMNVGSAEELDNPESAVLLWTRYWQDRAIEFRPAVAKRVVWRLGQWSTAGRRQDVRELDTYALSELVSAMPPVRDQEDVKRARRLATAAARITGQPWRVPKGAGPAEAREVVHRWQSWWQIHQSDYLAYDGAERVLAMVSDTEYGSWLAEAAQNRLGTAANGRPVLDLLRERARVTLWLVLASLVGGWVAGVLLGLSSAARAQRPPDWVLSGAAVTLAALPLGALVTFLAPGSVGGLRAALAGAVMLIAAAAYVSRHQRASTRVALDQEYTRTARAFGAGPWRVAFWSFRASSVASVSLIATEVSTALTTAFVVEHALGLPGLAAPTLLALQTRDVAWLMTLALGTATAVALVQIVSDLALAALDPRVALAMSQERRGGR